MLEVIKSNILLVYQIVSVNDMYKRLQEYNTSLQQYNSKLQTELNQTSETLSRVEREKAALMENLSNLKGYHESQQEQLATTKVGFFSLYMCAILHSFACFNQHLLNCGLL